jgi:exopolysaccharide biosynthesis polyprenyl glycosylphosphotransferase
VIAWRAAYSRFLSRPTSAIRLLLIGDAAICRTLAQAAAWREGYYRVLGYVGDDAPNEQSFLGAPEQLLDIVSRQSAHRIIVAPGVKFSSELVSALSTCLERGLGVMYFNAAYEEIAGKVAVDHAGDNWLAALPTGAQTSALTELAIRVMDITGAAVGLAITAALFPFLAAAIRLESSGPIIFRQQRLGRGGRPFVMLKLRSMRSDAEAQGARFADQEDTRATRVGRLLRRSHLDELPQFWNVFRGEMSLVGPRPERPEFTDALAEAMPFYRLRLAVRPGVTGLKQIRVGYATTPDEHLDVLRHDLYYIKHRSLALNCVILARTLGSVIGMDGR